ncbi:MAG: glycosyltransferase [Thermoleophilaceae bacterium]|nr:glycosyltransferase [Thermoleophilaceae bacterium]
MSRVGESRVALVYDHLYPFSVGGAERYYWTLARALARETPVTQVAPRVWEGPRVRTEAGVEQVGVGGRGAGAYSPKLAFAFGAFAHFLRHGGRYSVVHCCCFPAIAVLAVRAGLVPHRGARLVVDWHEVLPRSTWRRRRGRIGDLGWFAQRAAVGCGTVAVTFSRMHERRLRDAGRRGAVRVLPEFTPEDEAAVAEGHANVERERLIVFAGRLVGEKRAHLVPGVLAELRAAQDGWRAVVFGRGEDFERVQEEARAAGVADALEMAGFAPWEDVSRAMHRASALVFPTTREGFGLVVLEAAAHGLPSVLVAEPDNAAVELIEEGVNGHVCASADPGEQARAVLALAQDPAIHARTRDWYERASERYSVPNAVRELHALHAEL